MKPSGTLYLVPAGLGDATLGSVLPDRTLRVLAGLSHFVVENPKSARALLKSAGYPLPIRQACMTVLDEHTRASDIAPLLDPILDGADCGLLCEAGCPSVADPGAALVNAAHAAGIRVVPLVGPSSILLALMASGLNGQRFAFHGYLPRAPESRARKLGEVERASARDDATQIFIETPYRNSALLASIFDICRPDTMLCVATDITLASESIVTRAIAAWKATPPAIDRRPTVFLLYRNAN